MYLSFFIAAARSPSRQAAWRTVVALHVLVVGGVGWWARTLPPGDRYHLGAFLLVAGIVEGALLIGWRLSQLPRSRSLEFLLASPLRPPLVFLSEAGVGVARLALTTLAGLPFLLLLALDGVLRDADVALLLLVPPTFGAAAGLTLTVWAYEPQRRRRIAERIMLLLVLVYLIVGLLAGEKLAEWLSFLPGGWKEAFVESFHLFHNYNPFAVLRRGMMQPFDAAWPLLAGTELAAIAIAALLLARAALRLQGHFQERHYRPVADLSGKKRPPIGLRPLSWWAVKRVSEYSGRVNLWLAGGFGILYAAHTLAGEHWPAWMGRQAFTIFDSFFGIAGVATALVILAAVPAAFQYGLWDSNTQDRCRRLELLLLTRLDASDFAAAALAAAWRRGSGYFLVAVLLFAAAALGGKLTAAQFALAVASSVVLWLLYFSLGFRSFSTGLQANNLGMLLTVGLPLASLALASARLPALAALTPPGMVYLAATTDSPPAVLPGFLLACFIALYVHRTALARCLEELQRWYEKYHGRKVME